MSQNLSVSRTRMVSFRVTDEEYDLLLEASGLADEALSEFLRDATLGDAQAACRAGYTKPPSVQDRLVAIEQRLSQLQKTLDRLSNRMQRGQNV